MSDLTSKATVLVLNSGWLAINAQTPAQSFCQMATGVATALDIGPDGAMQPLPWEQWLQLPVRAQDAAARTATRVIRIPTVIVLANFSNVPKKRPKLCARSIRERDGNRCQYSGRALRPDEGSIDHVLPRSRGGGDTWDNCVWADKAINHAKGSRLPHEAGLRLLRMPRPLLEQPVTGLIRNVHGVKDWEHFL